MPIASMSGSAFITRRRRGLCWSARLSTDSRQSATQCCPSLMKRSPALRLHAGLRAKHLVDDQRLFFVLHLKRIKWHAVKVPAYLLIRGQVNDDFVIGRVGLQPRSDVDRVADGRIVLQAVARPDVADGCHASIHADAIADR